MDMGFAPTWLRQVSPPLLLKTTLTTEHTQHKFEILKLQVALKVVQSV